MHLCRLRPNAHRSGPLSFAGEDLGIELENTVYAFDSTTIDLCLSLFPWAVYRRTKAAIKLHALLDLRGAILSFIKITDGKTHDIRVLDDLTPKPGCFYILDRAYIDYGRLFTLHQNQAFFVIRAKSYLQCSRLFSRPVDKAMDLCCDQTVILSGFYTQQGYPDRLRRICFYNRDNARYLTFLTNNFSLPALTLALHYKLRWQIEFFFRWINQNLRIKTFYGTSENAVKTPIWEAITVYVLAAITKRKLALSIPLYTFLQILSVAVLEKIPSNQLVSESCSQFDSADSCNQLFLFNL